ncbi:MAG: futalosine hydrolase [Phycisphaeraceae bacterium]|nr:futalosine hydrolase [Phycisphaeraceae bacterium]
MVAAAVEARAIHAGFRCAAPIPDHWERSRLHERFELLLCGVGKSNAAGAAARAIALDAPSRVLNLGICGALPHPQPLQIRESVLASRCVLADEGIATDGLWLPLAKAGFPSAIDGDAISTSDSFNHSLTPFADRVGAIATVSTCSGNDERAREIFGRCAPDGLAEAMEGAAIGIAAQRSGIPFAELRVVSNRAGHRDSQGWDLKGALARLEAIAAGLARQES